MSNSATVKTSGVIISMKSVAGANYTRTFNGLDFSKVEDATAGAKLAEDYSPLLDGTLTSARYLTDEPAPVDVA